MTSEEHKSLANLIKSTHALLRKESHELGAEKAWERHVKRSSLLQNYATSMQKLATTCWIENNTKSRNIQQCRVEWIKYECKEYFYNGGKKRYSDKEANILCKISEKENLHSCNNFIENVNQPVSMLDVGSCYNPFSNDDSFIVTAIDLYPALDSVLKCDFLNVDIRSDKILSIDQREVLQLQRNSFDIVVFSLFLEYLPCPKQRFLCCKKAYELLTSGGILVIITPDSKHVGANAKIMKSWRYVLCKLGFMRIKYEKLQHIHCLIFRKCMYKNVAVRWGDLQTIPNNSILFESESCIYIPQDFNILEAQKIERKLYDIDDVATSFQELPFCDS